MVRQGTFAVALVSGNNQPRLVGEQLRYQRAIVMIGRGQGEVEDKPDAGDEQTQFEATEVLFLGWAMPEVGLAPPAMDARHVVLSDDWDGDAVDHAQVAAFVFQHAPQAGHDGAADAIGDLDQVPTATVGARALRQ